MDNTPLKKDPGPAWPLCVNLTLEFNPHAVYYQTLEDWLTEQEGLTWVTEEEKERALLTGDIWVAQWYPDTPIGFHRLAAHSLLALQRGMATVTR